MPMVLFLVAVVVIAFALAALKVLPLLAALGVVLGAVLFAAWRLDRTRSSAARLPSDPDRPDFYGRSGESSWEVPTAYIDHSTGAGTPPGVDPSDEPARR